MEKHDTYLVYVVDDDDIFLKSLKFQLEQKWQNRIEIKVFHTGEELLKYIPEQQPDIIILDYILNSRFPYAMDGALVLQKIKQTYPEIKVIMLSGQSKIQVALDSIQNGAFDYVIKNDNVFFKMQASLKNAIRVIGDSNHVKNMWLLLAAMALLIGVSVTSVILIRVFFF